MWGRFVRGKWWIAALAALGLFLIMTGVRQWHAGQGPKQTIYALVEAIKTGNRAAAERLMAPEPDAAARRDRADLAGNWVPAPDLQSRIHHMDLLQDTAVVQLWLSDHGYTVKPEVLLQRFPDGSWKIAEIANLRIDPRWEEAQNRRMREQDELLARELEAAVKDLPGVMVERETASEIRRR